ncbi:hypothetical protein GCM10010246_80310 [Streptomyces cuspidosporus]|uniref:Uncharacterized protein n=1 Tax=Streptomyces cuspidosporus TaxID=66882 RepID=A0ABN3H9Z4_9ACTN
MRVLLNLGFYGLLFLTTVYFQWHRGFDPLGTGLALLPVGRWRRSAPRCPGGWPRASAPAPRSWPGC